jgi:hypothetical protein
MKTACYTIAVLMLSVAWQRTGARPAHAQQADPNSPTRRAS